MKSNIVQVRLSDGNIQKYQLVDGFDWSDIHVVTPSFDSQILTDLARLYTINIIPKDPASYGLLVFYAIGDSMVGLDRNTEIGYVYNDQVLFNYYCTTAYENHEISISNDNICFENNTLQSIFDNLVACGRVAFSKGSAVSITFYPVSHSMGYLRGIPSYQMLVNSHFFLMEGTDIDSPYDEIGTPFGLALQDFKIISPPLHHRECLLVDHEANVSIRTLEVSDLLIKLDDHIFEHGINATYYYRPETRVTPTCNGSALVLIKDTVVAVKEGGQVVVPMAGFVVQTDSKISFTDRVVTYHGESTKYVFGIQVGPAMVVDGKQATSLTCPFFKGDGIAYPTTAFPLDFAKGRASRIGLGSLGNKPILIWAEGAGKLGYVEKVESCGASLLEFSTFCKELGIENLINLDGGGSAQILYDGTRLLKIADREADTISEAERPISMGLGL